LGGEFDRLRTLDDPGRLIKDWEEEGDNDGVDCSGFAANLASSIICNNNIIDNDNGVYIIIMYICNRSFEQ
jgi:hypothetical protein